jgi:mannose-6-phosphate isomerase-like protein (cupin superfamily)
MLATTQAFAQAGGGGGAPAQTWWVEKTQGGVYKAPMRPIWRKADLLKMHAGKTNWSEQIIKDAEQDVTYNSGAPGFKITPRLKPDTGTLFVVISGDVEFSVEGQQPVTATKGALVSVPKTTIYSAEVKGASNALWVEVNPANYKVMYPSSEAQPAAKVGGQIIKVGFNHTPGAYTAPNQLHFNTLDAIAKCEPMGVKALYDHIWSSPLLGYPDASKNKCTPGQAGNIGGGPNQPAFVAKSTFGHMHAGPAEWWIVQVGKISGRFENQGEFIAEEGDVLYAAPMMWHQMAALDTSGPNVRLAMGGYGLINMNNTAPTPAR